MLEQLIEERWLIILVTLFAILMVIFNPIQIIYDYGTTEPAVGQTHTLEECKASKSKCTDLLLRCMAMRGATQR